jgi:photosystem II stability/assembly factor-like uncharacterized protein
MATRSICAAIISALLCLPASAQWTQTTISGGATVALAFAVSGGDLFAGTQDGGVLRSTDGGAHWTPVNNDLPDVFVRALAVSGTKLFAGTFGSGVFLSTDHGAGWTAVNTNLPGANVQALTVSGLNLFAGFLTSVSLSTNNGGSWTEVNSGLPSLPDIRAFAVSGTTLFAGTSGAYPRGVYLSTDNGSHWTTVNNALTSENIRALAVSGTILYAGTDGSGVFLSANNGTSWTAVNTGLPTNASGNALAVSGTTIFAGSASGSAASGVFVSTDSGAHWTEVGNGLTNPDVVALIVAGPYLLAGTFGGGIWRRLLSEMVTSVPAEGISPDMPEHLSLEQNYPNPFNPSTILRYQLPAPSGIGGLAGSSVKLTIYDLLGREVATLVNEVEHSGTHSVQWNPTGLASGVYLVRLLFGDAVESRRMMLLR